jgi:hypothetical protein
MRPVGDPGAWPVLPAANAGPGTGIVVCFYRYRRAISYNTDRAYDIGMQYRIILMQFLHIVYEVSKIYDITYDIVCYVVYKNGKNGIRDLRYSNLYRHRIQYRTFGVQYRMFDILYNIQYRMQRSIQKWQEWVRRHIRYCRFGSFFI